MRILYFGPLKDVTGVREEHVVLERYTRAGVLEYVAAKYPQAGELLPSCAVSVDLEYIGADTPDAVLGEHSDVALIPPVSAG